MIHTDEHNPALDPTTPEVDTKAGGFYITVILVLSASLALSWVVLSGYYRAAFTQPVVDSGVEIRLQSTREASDSLLNSYAAETPAEGGPTQYRIPANVAATVVLDDPTLLGSLPGTPVQADIPAEAYELPDLPSADDFRTDGTAQGE